MRTYRHVEKHHRDILNRGPEHLRKSTRDYWHAWLDRDDFAHSNEIDKSKDRVHMILLLRCLKEEGIILFFQRFFKFLFNCLININ